MVWRREIHTREGFVCTEIPLSLHLVKGRTGEIFELARTHIPRPMSVRLVRFLHGAVSDTARC